jgi:methionine sulfoxide reductase heme-binding subunit
MKSPAFTRAWTWLNTIKVKVNPWRILVHASAWFLVAWLIWDYYSGNLTINPIQAATQRTGRIAIAFLVLSLAVTPLNTLFGFRQALTVRRTLGLYAFMFALIHVTMFVGVDYGFDIPTLVGETYKKPYIIVGLSTFLILIPLAITSFRWWMKRLGKHWRRLHRLVYLAGALAVVHYAWAVKGNILTLQGDIAKPFLYALIVAALLLARLPVVRRTASKLRFRRFPFLGGVGGVERHRGSG